MAETTAYISLARKYRPQTIEQLIGQEALVQTLRNSFELNRIASAFVLTGTRGIGKTTTARIIAKALNCIGPNGNGGITLNPCGVCEPCLSIAKDKFIDVIEIDAASKTGVDDIREIIENSHYKPTVARYKVFIIDEVHMLSKSAFNALLKTLEEPPEHAKFIFATTEIRKVPITILSRCQRFDLRKITTPILQQHLQHICHQEQIKYEEAGLFLLAKAGAGSVRDSLSLLDQAIVYSNKNITANNIERMLGQADKGKLYDLYLAIVKNDKSLAFKFLNETISEGIIIEILIEDLITITHYVSVYLTLKDNNILELTDTQEAAIIEIAQVTNLATILSLWQILLQGYQEVRESNDPIAFTNMVLIKLLFVNQIGNLDDFINNASIQHNTLSSPLKENNSLSQAQATTIIYPEIKTPSISEITGSTNLNAASKITTNLNLNHIEQKPVLEEKTTSPLNSPEPQLTLEEKLLEAFPRIKKI